ncbi:hypothetical protein N9L68_04515 [bacterium]|nr:hypothetical protein [bacterium]
MGIASRWRRLLTDPFRGRGASQARSTKQSALAPRAFPQRKKVFDDDDDDDDGSS